MDEKAVKRLLDSADGRALVVYIGQKIQELDSLSGIDSTTAERIAIEVRARECATEKLREIFSMFLAASEQAPQPHTPGEYVV